MLKVVGLLGAVIGGVIAGSVAYWWKASPFLMWTWAGIGSILGGAAALGTYYAVRIWLWKHYENNWPTL